MRTLAAAAVLIAAIQAADPAACTPYAHACGITFHGLYVREGVVWDVVTPSCDQPPEAHYIQTWIEY